MHHILVLELLQVAPVIALGEGVFAGEGAGERAPAERGVGDNGDAEFVAGSGDVVFEDGSVPEGELDFDGRDRARLGSADTA